MLKQILSLMVLSVLLTACGKSMDKNGPGPTAGPTSPGVDDGTPLPTPVHQTGFYSVNFANSSTTGSHNTVNEVNSNPFSFNAKVILPNEIFDASYAPAHSSANPVSIFTFDQDEDMDSTLSVDINGDEHCRYFRTGTNKLILEPRCVNFQIQLDYGDRIKVTGFYKDTVNLVLYYEKN